MAALPFDASSTSCPASVEAARQPAAQRVVIVGDQYSAHDVVSPFCTILNQLDCDRHRQRHPEPRPVARLAAQIDPSVVRVDDLPHDRQPQPGALWPWS